LPAEILIAKKRANCWPNYQAFWHLCFILLLVATTTFTFQPAVDALVVAVQTFERTLIRSCHGLQARHAPGRQKVACVYQKVLHERECGPSSFGLSCVSV